MEKSWNFVSPKKWEPCSCSPYVIVKDRWGIVGALATLFIDKP